MGRDQVLETIADSIREVMPQWPCRALRDTETLSDLGADSVDRAEIISVTLEKLDLRLPLARLARARNVGELADAIRAQP